MDTKQLKIFAGISIAILVGGIILYSVTKKNPPVSNVGGSNTAVQPTSDAEVLLISSATGIDKGLISVGDKTFIDAWYKGLQLGNDTFTYNGTYFYTKNGEQFS